MGRWSFRLIDTLICKSISNNIFFDEKSYKNLFFFEGEQYHNLRTLGSTATNFSWVGK